MGTFQVFCLLLCTLAGEITASSEGRSFVFAFSQVRSDFLEGSCVVYINSKVSTMATIVDPNGASNTYNIDANVTYSEYFDYDFRVDSGVENKAFIIESDDDISVMLGNYRNDGHMDTILVPPVTTDPQQYMVITYPSINDITCVSGATCGFFTVAAYMDDTEVNIYNMVDGDAILEQAVTLNVQQVFTNRTLNNAGERNIDFTGYYVTADKPVAVTAGNPCADTNPAEVAGAIWASMPLDQQAGTRYISHTLNYNSYSGPTIVRVMALEDNTQVTYDGNTNIIEFRGQFEEYTLTSNVNGVFDCDKPCRAAQYSTNSASTNPSGAAVFMAVLVPTDGYGQNVVFTKPEEGSPSLTMVDYMSIVYLTETPDSAPLYYDGVELTGWDVQTGFSSLELEIDGFRETLHSLITDANNPGFSALIHGQSNEARGYAYQAGFATTGSDPGPNPNITRPNPQYRIAMTGNFQSDDGTSFTPSCTDSYSTEMTDVSAGMVVQVNGMIGSSLCSSQSTDDLELLGVSTPFVTNGNEGSTELRFIMRTDLSRITQDQVVVCGDEIGSHLLDHANWRNPILPQLPGCPAVLFNSLMFNDSGKDWVCLSGQKDAFDMPVSHVQATLKYALRHNGFLSTVDGSDLTAGCVADYNDAFDQSTVTQVRDVQGQISGGSMCSGTGVNIEAGTTALTAQGSEAASHQTYVFLLGSQTLAPDVYSCVTEVSTYLSPHSNWIQPILPTPQGCPSVAFDPEVFSEEGQEWICV